MKMKGKEIVCRIASLEYGGKALAFHEGWKVYTDHGIPDQLVRVQIRKAKNQKLEARTIEVLERSPLESTNACEHSDLCGGCTLQGVEYFQQVALKTQQVKDLFAQNELKVERWEESACSPEVTGYRNKMEFSFGNEYREGPLTLGMHRRGRRYDVVDTAHCLLVDDDIRSIRQATVSFFRIRGILPYHKITHRGDLRHLVVRKAKYTGEILVNLVTTSQTTLPLGEWKTRLLKLPLEGKIVGILWTCNDSVADVVRSEGVVGLYGPGQMQERLCGLNFTITPFSFFQTNSKAAEILYQLVRDMAAPSRKHVLDLYCGLGTISQILAKEAKKVTGVELDKNALSQARIDSLKNGIDNCQFIAGDVKDTLDQMPEQMDVLVVDPPRPGVHPKAMDDLLGRNASRFIYVSCNPKTLVSNLLQAKEKGWRIEKSCCVDLFPHTPHVECVVLMSRTNKPE